MQVYEHTKVYNTQTLILRRTPKLLLKTQTMLHACIQ